MGEQFAVMWRKLSPKRILLIVISLALVVFGGGSGVYALLTPTLRLTASVAKTNFQIGEMVHIDITIQNVGLWPIRFTYRQPLFDYVVYNEAGQEIAYAGGLLYDGVNPVTLWPTQATSARVRWDQLGYVAAPDIYQVPKGTYRIVTLIRIYHINRLFLLTAQPIIVTIE